MQFTSETSSNGVIERTFTLGDVTGVLWSPANLSGSTGLSGRTPLILAGHGGGLHKKAPGLMARAHRSVTVDGFHVASIDAPGHGDRPRNTRDQQWVAEFQQARRAGEPYRQIIAEYNESLAQRAVPEWQATIDALTALPEIGVGAGIGYSGMTLASMIGIPLAAVEPRITAAVFGGVFITDTLTAAANKVTIPVEVLLPWDDEELSRESGLELFDAFASEEKVLHAFPGNHRKVPADGRLDTGFFARHLRLTNG